MTLRWPPNTPALSSNSLIERAKRDTDDAIAKGSLPAIVVHFHRFRETVRLLKEKTTELQNHVDSLSYETLPTMFEAAGVKTINVVDVGRVTINRKWTATMLDKEKGMEWLRESGNGALIIETVANPTLIAFARDQASVGKPLPDSIFKVGTAPYVSVTKV